ncbi:hypothetical protein NC651_013585 [Populus alba x Populus x berolinensis]|nr:hypothetical protein NC651_013585 [Populus alba x Populus x berolinensis]
MSTGRQIPRTTQENMQYGSDCYIDLVLLKTDKTKLCTVSFGKDMNLKVSLSERVLMVSCFTQQGGPDDTHNKHPATPMAQPFTASPMDPPPHTAVPSLVGNACLSVTL